MLSEQVAQDQLQIFHNYYDIDLNSMGEDQKTVVENTQRRLLKAIQNDLLTITDEDGIKITQTLKRPPGSITTIEYAKISGKSRLAMKEGSGDYARMYSLLGSLSGLGINAISSLEGQDLSTAEYLAVLFLAV